VRGSAPDYVQQPDEILVTRPGLRPAPAPATSELPQGRLGGGRWAVSHQKYNKSSLLKLLVGKSSRDFFLDFLIFGLCLAGTSHHVSH